MVFEKIHITELKAAEYNPRKDLKPGDPEFEKLKRSLEQFGYVEPVIWNKTTGNVVGGHQRLKVLMAMGMTEIECVVVELSEEKLIIERLEKDGLKVLNEGTLTVGLDSKITDELKKEGYVRDLVRGIQNLRKESGLNVTDRIKLSVSGDADLKAAFEMFADFVKGEVLASSAEFASSISNTTEVDADDKKWSISIEKA